MEDKEKSIPELFAENDKLIADFFRSADAFIARQKAREEEREGNK
jgi:hypothetical protein